MAIEGQGSPPRVRFTRYLVAAGAAAALLLAVFDPSPSHGLGFLARVLFWLLHCGAGLALFAWVNRWGNRLGLARWLGPWGATIAAGAVGSIALVPLALLFEAWLGVPEGVENPLEEALASAGWLGAALDEYSNLVVPATGLWVALNAPWLLRLDFSRRTPSRDEPSGDQTFERVEAGVPATSSEAIETAAIGNSTEADPLSTDSGASVAAESLESFLSNLPVALGRDLVALSSELQYLTVYTTKGQTLVLHTLRGAVDKLSSLDGHQVHRSHWVAARHVRKVVKEGRNMRLAMDNGVEIPVSRAFQKQVREVFGDHRSTYRAVE